MLRFPRISILCYDGDTNEGGGEGSGDAGEGAGGTANTSEKTFSQEDLNKFLAEDRRKHQERYKQLEGSYQQLLENQNLDKEARSSLQKQLDDLQAAHRTKEQEAEFQRKKAEGKYREELESERTRANHWETLFKTTEVRRSLQDAAVAAEAFNPSHIVALLQPRTELKEEDGKLVPMVRFEDIDEKTGSPVETLRTPADAVKRMRDLPKIHGNLFKSNVVSGVGAGQANVGSGEIDYTNMTAEEYRKHREAIRNRVGQR